MFKWLNFLLAGAAGVATSVLHRPWWHALSVIIPTALIAVWLDHRYPKAWHRFVRWVWGLDNCELCDGTWGVRGNENVLVVGEHELIACDRCTDRHLTLQQRLS